MRCANPGYGPLQGSSFSRGYNPSVSPDPQTQERINMAEQTLTATFVDHILAVDFDQLPHIRPPGVPPSN